MNIYSTLKFSTLPPCVTALGSFDGVHAGHRAVIGKAKEIAKEKNLSLTIFTFQSSPKNFFAPNSTPQITDIEEKKHLMSLLGADNLVIIPFTAEISSLEPDDFFRKIILEKLATKSVVCGFNYSFGKGGRGNTALLDELCRESRTDLFVHPPITVDGEIVSSSEIRKALANGDTARACKFLARPFSINAVVTEGKQLARQLGFPTINQAPPPGTALPKNGVYLTRTMMDGTSRFGITNIGTRPTVNGESVICETHIFDFDGNLYGKKIRVKFFDFLRPEQKFSSVEDMSKQIFSDIGMARKLITLNDSFDEN